MRLKIVGGEIYVKKSIYEHNGHSRRYLVEKKIIESGLEKLHEQMIGSEDAPTLMNITIIIK